MAATVMPDRAHANELPGLVPLPQMEEPYQVVGEPGLYPGGANLPSGDHADYGIAKLGGVAPRMADGAKNVDEGLVGVLGIGMSNANQQFSRFERESDEQGAHSQRVVVVTAAHGGADVHTLANAESTYWSAVDSKLSAAGLSPEQIQVAWMYNSVGGETGSFPDTFYEMRDALSAAVEILRDRYPNLAAIYVSPRAYGGFVSESRGYFTYETGFAYKWLIEDHVAALDNGEDVGPYLAWGPYLWANGECPNDDGLFWAPTDFEDDGSNPHPSEAGERKAALRLREFFRDDPELARFWEAREDAARIIDANADATLDPDAPDTNSGGALELRMDGNRSSLVRFSLEGIDGPISHAKLSLLVGPEVAVFDTAVFVVSGAWDEDEVTAANAPPAQGEALALLPPLSRGAAMSVDVTQAIASSVEAGETEISFLIRSDKESLEGAHYVSSEGPDVPRLVVSFPEEQEEEPGDTDGETGEETGGGETGGEGEEGGEGEDEGEPGDTGASAEDEGADGCACRQTRRDRGFGSTLALSGLLLGLVWRRRRSRR